MYASEYISHLDVEMVRIRSQISEPEPDPEDFRSEHLGPNPVRGPIRSGSGSNRIDPELHNFAKIFLFRTHKMMIHPDFLLLFTAVLVTIFIYLAM
jgi:hypothetical protein